MTAGEASGQRSQPRKRSRPNAWRSCRACKDRKQRCELPEQSTLLDPSQAALDGQHACTRCHVMAIPCVLDDYDKEARIAMERRKRSRRGAEQTGTVGIDEQNTARDVSPPPRLSVSSITLASTALTSTASSSGIASTGTGVTPASAAQSVGTSSSTQSQTHPEDLHEFKRYSTRSRPLTLASELSVRQPSFCSMGLLLSALVPDDSVRADVVDEVVNAQMSEQLSVWCEDHLHVWLPGLPAPAAIRRARLCHHPLSSSVRLLEVAQYLIAIQHSSLPSVRALRQTKQAVQLARIIETLLARCILGSQRDIDAARAFELLSAFPIAPAYLDKGKTGKVATLEVSLLASASRRIACVCRNETLQRNGRARLGARGRRPQSSDVVLTPHEVELDIQWCSSTAWDFCHGFGSDDVIHEASMSYVVRSLPMAFEVEDMLKHLRNNPTPGRKGLGQAFVLLRSYRLAQLSKSWQDLLAIAPNNCMGRVGPELQSEAEFIQGLRRVCKQFEEDGHDVKALRYAWLENHALPQASMLLQWLDIEDAAWYVGFYGLALFYSFQHGCTSVRMFTPALLVEMINEYPPENLLRQFTFAVGDDRLDVVSGLLSMSINFANIPLPEHDLVFPPLVTTGYLMEACMISVEVHATTAKIWRTMPRRHHSYVQGMRGVLTALRRMNDVSEEEGGALQTCARIVKGMLDIVQLWQKAIIQGRMAKKSMLADSIVPAADDAAGMRSGADSDPLQGRSTTVDASALEHGKDVGLVAGLDIGIPPLATDNDDVTIEQLLRDLFGSTEWADVLQGMD